MEAAYCHQSEIGLFPAGEESLHVLYRYDELIACTARYRYMHCTVSCICMCFCANSRNRRKRNALNPSAEEASQKPHEIDCI